MTDWTVTSVVEGLHRIQLPGWAELGAGARPTNVYLAAGEQPALVGAGHPTHGRELTEALDSVGVAPSDIQRIVIGSWSPAVLGGCKAFPRADWFITSTDMVRPRAWDTWCREMRAGFLGLADEVFERRDDWTRQDLEGWLDLAFPAVSNHLEFVPLRSGQSVRTGAFRLEVVWAPGPNPGHAMLWEAERGLLFAGDLDSDGLPSFVSSVRDYLVSIERAAGLDSEWFLPSRGEPSSRPAWTLKKMLRFANNYLSNIAPTLAGGKTLMEVVDGDLGHVPEHPAVYLEALRKHRPFLEELVGSRMIQAEGEGLDRRYGVDVEDTRFRG